MTTALPILYSFRRCPYAIRARMAIKFAALNIQLIEIDLKNKLDEFVQLSPKATVPVLKVNSNHLIEESLEIMQWAFLQKNSEEILIESFEHDLIKTNDGSFKQQLDYYKYADRFPEHSVQTYQQNACEFPQTLNSLLGKKTFLVSDQISTIDIALFPFIRQFSFVDKTWFDQQPWPHLQRWLQFWLDHDIFKQAFAWGRTK